MADREVAELTKLDGTNYSMWKFGVTIALRAKELLGYVDGTIVKPAAAEAGKFTIWQQKSAQTSMILLCSVDKALHANLINCETPANIWTKLCDLYGDSSIDAKQTAWEQFYAFRIEESASVAVQLECFESICKKLSDAGETITDSAVISKILSSLPAKFSVFRIAWECTPEAQRTKASIITRLIKEDKRMAEEEVVTHALHVKATSIKNSSANSRKQNIEELKKRTRCSVCKQKGHWARECPDNDAASGSVRSSSSKHGKAKPVYRTVSAFVSDVVATTQPQRSKNNRHVWYADSGARMHMSCRRDFFFELQPNFEELAVVMADDRYIKASGIGKIRVEEEIEGQRYERELHDVLFVPELQCNLFSIGAVTAKGFSYYADKNKSEFRDSDGILVARAVPREALMCMRFRVKVVSSYTEKHMLCSSVGESSGPSSLHMPTKTVPAAYATVQRLNFANVHRPEPASRAAAPPQRGKLITGKKKSVDKKRAHLHGRRTLVREEKCDAAEGPPPSIAALPSPRSPVISPPPQPLVQQPKLARCVVRAANDEPSTNKFGKRRRALLPLRCREIQPREPPSSNPAMPPAQRCRSSATSPRENSRRVCFMTTSQLQPPPRHVCEAASLLLPPSSCSIRTRVFHRSSQLPAT